MERTTARPRICDRGARIDGRVVNDQYTAPKVGADVRVRDDEAPRRVSYSMKRRRPLIVHQCRRCIGGSRGWDLERGVGAVGLIPPSPVTGSSRHW